MRSPCPSSLALSSLLALAPLACDSSSDCGDNTNCIEPEDSGSETEAETGTETGDGDGDAEPPDLGSCAGDEPIVVIETSLGTMVLQLDGLRAPITVGNFVTYVATGFYDGTIFHRVINNFVIQGGGYEPGLVLKPTTGQIPLEIHPELRHVDGAIAMARSQDPDTAESQWYITDGAQAGLDDDYAVFGAIIEGYEIRNAISSVETGSIPFMGTTVDNVPVEDVLVSSVYCVEDWP